MHHPDSVLARIPKAPAHFCENHFPSNYAEFHKFSCQERRKLSRILILLALLSPLQPNEVALRVHPNKSNQSVIPNPRWGTLGFRRN